MKQNMKGKRWLSATPLPTLFQNYVKENINLMHVIFQYCRIVQSFSSVSKNCFGEYRGENLRLECFKVTTSLSRTVWLPFAVAIQTQKNIKVLQMDAGAVVESTAD